MCKYSGIREAVNRDTNSALGYMVFKDACHPGVIRDLVKERDALREFVEAKMHHLPIEDQYVAAMLVRKAQEGRP